MKQSKLCYALCAGLFAGAMMMSGAAHAVLLTDFTGADSTGAALAFNGGTVTATDGGFAANVVQTSDDGLGVTNSVVDDNTPPGAEGSELLIFTMDNVSSLGTWVFSESAGALDSFDVFVDGVDIDVVSVFGSDIIRDIGTPGFGGDNEKVAVDLSLLGFGTVFAFTDGTGQDGGDDYSIARIEVNPVPVPAALPLLASALVGLGFAGYRRRKSAA